jgi:hypothetical protein
MTDLRDDSREPEPYRRFVMEGDGEWLVWLLSDAALKEIRAPSSLGVMLIFIGPDGETRRLSPVPAQWQQMTDSELSELARAARPFPQGAPDRDAQDEAKP